jgi:aldose 1-epimerase
METLLFEIKSLTGLSVKISPIGATVCSIRLDGRELTLGYPEASAYLSDPYYLGCTVGPYANRIHEARFQLQQRWVQLTANDGRHCLHGGSAGLNRLEWQVELHQDEQLTLRCSLPDGAGGFPGNRLIRCHFTVRHTDLQIQFEATTDAPTVLSLTNHCYFNLDASHGDIAGHRLQTALPRVLEKDATGIPTGRLLESATAYPQLAEGVILDRLFRSSGGLDHCFVVADSVKTLQPMATLESADRRFGLTVLSDLPGLQIYSGDGLGAPFKVRQGICLEAQYWPDAPNQPAFPSTLLLPGQDYAHQIIYRFAHNNVADSND